MGYCQLSAAGFKALAEAAWPALTSLGARQAAVQFEGPHALGAAAFAGFPALEDLVLVHMELGEAGARLLASRRWPRLQKLDLFDARLGVAGIAALARGEWPALVRLRLAGNGLGVPPTLEDVRRWAPALEELEASEEIEQSDSDAGSSDTGSSASEQSDSDAGSSDGE